MSILDLDNYTDPISDAIDAIGDAGDLIGDILKSISPILAAIPGIGTAFSVAVYAAGALAAKDEITDAMIGTASAAMPPGLPRIAFDGATRITRDIAHGRDAFGAALDACRQAASVAGGEPAVAAFDSGLAMVRGGRIDQRLIDQGRAFALQGGGDAAAASYDAGVAIAQGRGADQVVISVARGYIDHAGGPLAVSAFDTAVALGYGATLQRAGYLGLHTLVKGHNGIEKVMSFVEQVGLAELQTIDLQQYLEHELAADLHNALLAAGIRVDGAVIDEQLAPYVDVIRKNVGLLEVPSGDLAKQFGAREPVIRAAQALLRAGNGTLDDVMLSNLKTYRVPPSFDFSERNVTTNDGYAQAGRAIISRGARWRGRLLSDICAGSSFTVMHDALDPVGLTEPRQIVRVRETYEIDAPWRRGFEIAIGVCEGLSEDGLEQQRVKASLTGHTRNGFDAGQEVQFNRSNPFGLVVVLQQTTEAVGEARKKDASLPAVAVRGRQRPGVYMPMSVSIDEPIRQSQSNRGSESVQLKASEGIAREHKDSVKVESGDAIGRATQGTDSVKMDPGYGVAGAAKPGVRMTVDATRIKPVQ